MKGIGGRRRIEAGITAQRLDVRLRLILLVSIVGVGRSKVVGRRLLAVGGGRITRVDRRRLTIIARRGGIRRAIGVWNILLFAWSGARGGSIYIVPRIWWSWGFPYLVNFTNKKYKSKNPREGQGKGEGKGEKGEGKREKGKGKREKEEGRRGGKTNFQS